MSKIKEPLNKFASGVVDICLECMEDDFDEATHGKKHDKLINQASKEIIETIMKEVEKLRLPEDESDEDFKKLIIGSRNTTLDQVKSILNKMGE